MRDAQLEAIGFVIADSLTAIGKMKDDKRLNDALVLQSEHAVAESWRALDRLDTEFGGSAGLVPAWPSLKIAAS